MHDQYVNPIMDARTQPAGTLAQGLVNSIGRSIIVGDYDKVEFPTEAVLAKRERVSRSVTREALKMLTAKGLLHSRPRQGTVVQPSSSWNLFDPDVLRWLLDRQFSLDLLEQFNQLRVGIEPEAAALAATLATEAERDAITAGLSRMRSAEEGLDDPLKADIAFHVAILKASRNPFFIQFQDVVATALHASIQFTNRVKGHTANIADHASVRDAILSRNPARARRAMERLIRSALDTIAEAKNSRVKAKRAVRA